MQMQEGLINPPDPRATAIVDMWNDIPALASLPLTFTPEQIDAISDRFWSHVNKDGQVVCPELGACWEWRGWVVGTQRPQFSVNGKHRIASRVAWMLAGLPLLDKLNVCHRCDNPPCVRLSHLFMGTTQDNYRDMLNKKRHNPFGQGNNTNHGNCPCCNTYFNHALHRHVESVHAKFSPARQRVTFAAWIRRVGLYQR